MDSGRMRFMIKTLIRGSLHLQTSEDGVSLHFKTKKGKRAVVSLFDSGIGGPVVSSTIKAWAKEYAKGQSSERDKTQKLK